MARTSFYRGDFRSASASCRRCSLTCAESDVRRFARRVFARGVATRFEGAGNLVSSDFERNAEPGAAVAVVGGVGVQLVEHLPHRANGRNPSAIASDFLSESRSTMSTDSMRRKPTPGVKAHCPGLRRALVQRRRVVRLVPARMASKKHFLKRS